MSNINLHIGGRDYAVACAEGEEAHVRALGLMIQEKIATMGGSQHSETRSLLFAALLLADETHELRAQAAPSAPGLPSGQLDAIAARLENIASALES